MMFEDRPTAKTGRIGERILDDYLRQHDWIPYRPDADAPHPFDRLAASPDKRQLCIVEIKTKFRREAYADTGIEQRHYNDYQHVTMTYQVPLFLAFVDAKVGTMYGNWWSELLKTRESSILQIDGFMIRNATYPFFDRGIVYFPLSAMRTLYVLTDAERAELLALRTSRWIQQAGT